MNEFFDYDEIIENINNHKISELRFEVLEYPHYHDCKIIVNKEQLPSNNVIYLIEIFLTQDLSENVSFYNKFKENYKLFYMGRKGSFTLKQIWKKIKILEIIKFD